MPTEGSDSSAPRRSGDPSAPHRSGDPSARASGWNKTTIPLIGSMFLSSLAALALVTALGKQVYDITGRELDLGWLGLAEFAPAALLVLVTGPIADRHDRRRIASAALGAEVLVILLVLAFLRTEPASVTPLFGIVVLFGVARAFAAPASRALPADAVPASQLPWVVARWSVSFQLAAVLGPVIGASLYAIDADAPYVVSAALAAAAALLLLVVRMPVRRPTRAEADEAARVLEHSAPTLAALETALPEDEAAALQPLPGRAPDGVPADDVPPPGRLHEALEGLRFIRRQPILLGAIALDLFAVLFGGAVALLPALADQRLGVGAVGFGWLRAAIGIGAGVVTLVLTRRPITRHVGHVLLMSVALFGVFTVVLGVTQSYVLAFVSLLCLAGADALSVFIRSTLVPLVTPHDKRGRVLAVEMVFIGASNELGAFESGVTGQLLGPALAVVLGGMATIAVALAFWFLFPALRKVDRFPQGVEDGAPA